MDLNDRIINELFNMSKRIVDNDLAMYNYNSDIKHLLYIIIPAFIIKYNIKNQNKIINTFKEVPIKLNNKEKNSKLKNKNINEYNTKKN